MSNAPMGFDGFVEPVSAANTEYQPQYPYNNITQTRSGHSFELDDTPTRERIRLQHRSGTFTEMHPNGDQVCKILGNGYTITLGDHNILIGVDGQSNNKLNITVNGDVNLNVKGDFNQEVDGNYNLHVKGNYTQTVDQITDIASVGDMRITAGGFAGGALRINPGDEVRIEGDLRVSGEVRATLINSSTRVNAQTGMTAGIQGIVSLGGVSVGSPTPPIPGTVLATTSVIAPLLYGTSMTYGSVVMDPTGGLPMVRTLFNSHRHIAPNGPTSGPLPLMPLP
jgi:hypothetical protein